MVKFNWRYFLTFIALLLTEVFIAVFVHDKIIRPYVGDILVIILMYTFIRTFIKKSIKLLPIYLFIFACMVEVAQYFNIVSKLSLQDNALISTAIGTSFDFIDILCYFIGTIVLIIWQGKSINIYSCNKLN